MTKFSPISATDNVSNVSATTSINETYWGYIVRCASCDRSMAVVFQWIAAVMGGAMVLASVGFWAIPGSMMSPDVASFKLAMASLLGVFGVTLIWYASHGTEYETQLDLARFELREVLRNKSGVARVQSRIKFEEVDAVFIDRSFVKGDKVRLLVRLMNTAQVIEVARDYEEKLIRLRDRLGRDILGKTALRRTKANRGYILDGAQGLIKP